jgi:hypothetical protein
MVADTRFHSRADEVSTFDLAICSGNYSTARTASSKSWVSRTRWKRFEAGRKGRAVHHELLGLRASLAPNAPRSRIMASAIFGTYACVRECCSYFKRSVPARLACWQFRARRKAELAAMNRRPLIAGMTQMRRFMSCLFFSVIIMSVVLLAAPILLWNFFHYLRDGFLFYSSNRSISNPCTATNRTRGKAILNQG